MDFFLPEELIYQILIRVDAMSLLRFKVVCKRWRFLISDSEFMYAHLRYSKPDQIIFSWLHNMPYEEISCYSINMKENNIIMRPQEIQVPGEEYAQLCLKYSCNGMLLFQHCDYKYLIIYNPITRARKVLPPTQGYCRNMDLKDCHEWALVRDSYTRKYKVFGIKSSVEYFVFTQGKSDWKYVCYLEIPYGTLFTEIETDYSEVVCVDNKLYWTATLGTCSVSSIHSIDVMDDELMTMNDVPFRLNRCHRLSEVRGSLYITNIFHDCLETWVLMDRGRNLWNKCCRISYGADLSFINPYLGYFVVPRDIEDCTRFLNHIRFFLFDYNDRLTIYDVWNMEFTKIALKHKNGTIDGRHYFHINSLLSWE